MNRARRDLMTLARRGTLVATLATALGVSSACGGALPEDELMGDTITVRPRVALDGLIELSARTGGRLFVDEVVFHAPSVQIEDGPFAIADLLASDPEGADAVFFRYSLADGSGAGAVANERRWHLTPAGVTSESAVSFSFAPFAPSGAELDEVLARTGWDLTSLAGYTAYVHGYVSVTPADLSLREAKGHYGEDQKMAGDAEGDPARPHDGDKMAGDAEGDPARARDDDKMAGDAEGDPARSRDGEKMAGDAEGDPAEKASAHAGDPEGDPAEGADAKEAAFEDDERQQGPVLRRPGAASDGELVPFLLVFDGAAQLSVPLVDLGLSDLGDDEFLPIDLHVDVNRLLPDERLDDLSAEAAEVVRGAAQSSVAVLEVAERDVHRSFVLNLDAAQKQKPSETPRLHLTGDPRR